MFRRILMVMTAAALMASLAVPVLAQANLEVRIATSPPRHARHERIPPRPDRDSVWIKGYWHWEGSRWNWIDGRWERPRTGHTAGSPPATDGRERPGDTSRRFGLTSACWKGTSTGAGRKNTAADDSRGGQRISDAGRRPSVQVLTRCSPADCTESDLESRRLSLIKSAPCHQSPADPVGEARALTSRSFS